MYISASVPMPGSSYDSKIMLLVGGMSVITVLLVVVVVVFIGAAVIIKIKKQKGKTGKNLVILIHF